MSKKTDEEIKNLLDNIVMIRKKYGLSEKEMAKTIGISVNSLRKTENGELPPNVSVEVFLSFIIISELLPRSCLHAEHNIRN